MYEVELGIALLVVVLTLGLLLVAGLTGRLLDRLDRERTEASRSVEKLAAIVESSKDAITGLNLEGVILSWNRGAEQLYGYRAGEVVGRSVALLAPLERRDKLPEILARLARGEHIDQYETTRVHRDGRTLDVSLSISPVRDATGAVVGASTIASDVGERLRLERSLETSELKFRTLVNNIPGAVYRSAGRPPWTMDFISDEIEQMTGYPASDFIDDRIRTFSSIIHPLDREQVDQVEHNLADDRPFDLEYRVVHADESVRRVYERGQGQFAAGTLTHIDGVIFDVTAQKRLEDEYRQAQKLEAIGQLAGGVAHDFNNLLTAIQGYGDMLKDKLIEGRLNDTTEIDEILEASRRAAALTMQLLAFSRKQAMETRVVDLNEVVDQVGSLLRRLIGEHIELVTVLQPGLGRIEADPAQLETAIVNLAVNARDAMPDGGRLTIETANTNLDIAASLERDPVEPGRYVMLTVTDTGTGMDKQTLAHLFEPFFTTKPAGKGTGLGLATVYGIAKQSKGHVRVYSEQGKGTTFKVYLPLTAAEHETEDQTPEVIVRGGDERILVVEDEATLRVLVRLMLTNYGYTVLVAEDGEQALELLDRGETPIDLIVSDVVMPRMGGAELARRAAALRPEVKLLLVSGYPDDPGSDSDISVRHSMYLQKPFTQAELARKVRSLLDTPAANQDAEHAPP